MTNLYLTNTAVDAGVTVGSGTRWTAATAPGSSAVHLNKNSAAGPTAPLQMTDGVAGTDGTVVSWYTPPLHPVTIAGQVTCFLWDRENTTTDNVRPEIRIERTDGAGNILSTIIAPTDNHAAGEMPTTAGGATDTLTASAASVVDTTLSSGDRLRITLWIDDAVEGTTNMAAGGRGEMWVNGPTGSQGQAQIGFTEAIVPLSAPYMEAFEGARTNTTPKDIVVAGCEVGDVLYVLQGGDANTGAGVTAETVTTQAGSTGSWTNIAEALSSTQDDWIAAWSATVTGAGSVTVRCTRTQAGTSGTWMPFVVRVKNGTSAGLGDVVTQLTSGSGEVASLTVDSHAGVLFKSVDWDAGSPGSFTPTGAVSVEIAADANYTDVSGYWLDQLSGTRNYGSTPHAGTKLRIIALEILPPSTGTNVSAENVTFTVASQDATSTVKPSAENVTLAVDGQNATVVTAVSAIATNAPIAMAAQDTAIIVKASAECAAFGMAAQDATVTAVVLTNAAADVAPIVMAAQNATVVTLAVDDAPASDAPIAMAAQDATVVTAVAVAADLAPVGLLALDASASAAAATSAPAEVAPIALAGQDAAGTVATVADAAPIALAGMDASAAVRATVEAASAGLAAQDPQASISVTVDLASLAMVAENPTIFLGTVAPGDVAAFAVDAQTAAMLLQAKAESVTLGIAANDAVILTGTVLSPTDAPIGMTGQDATVSVQQNASATAECATFAMAAQNASVATVTQTNVSAQVAAVGIAGNDPRVAMLITAELSTIEFTAYPGVTFQPSGYMTVSDAAGSTMMRLTAAGAQTSGVSRVSASMNPTEAQGATMGSGD